MVPDGPLLDFLGSPPMTLKPLGKPGATFFLRHCTETLPFEEAGAAKRFNSGFHSSGSPKSSMVEGFRI